MQSALTVPLPLHRQVFKLTGSKKGTVAGCLVNQGKLQRSNEFALYRGKRELYRGTRGCRAARCVGPLYFTVSFPC